MQEGEEGGVPLSPNRDASYRETPAKVTFNVQKCGFLPGDHIGALYDTDEELRDLVRQYFTEGLTDPTCRQQCVYLYQQNTPEAFVSWFQEERQSNLSKIDVHKSIQTGDVALISAAMTLGAFWNNGENAILNFWMKLKNDALNRGYDCVRVAVEMGWPIAAGFPVNKLICYEACALNDNQHFGDRAMVIMCMCVLKLPKYSQIDSYHRYDRRMVGCRAQNGVIDSHPLVTLNNVSLQNPYFVRKSKVIIQIIYCIYKGAFSRTL